MVMSLEDDCVTASAPMAAFAKEGAKSIEKLSKTIPVMPFLITLNLVRCLFIWFKFIWLVLYSGFCLLP
jgi:hypothetical protein